MLTYFDFQSRAPSWDVIELDQDLAPYQVEHRTLTDRERDDFKRMFAVYCGRSVNTFGQES